MSKGYVGGFWLGEAIFIFMAIILEHFGLLTATNAGLIGLFGLIFLVLNILSWIVGDDN